MRIENLNAFLLLLVIPLIWIIKKKSKPATIIISNIQFVQQANSKSKYKYYDRFFLLRTIELFLLIVVISAPNSDLSITLNIVVTFFIFIEIFLKNTLWRTLP